ncbi:MAG: sugar ABC transporter substrate-binding protein [Firmicutes bacterium]|nr:sugar ABC transporter substrate-binding protein [Bacillota bacterium]
MKRLLVVLVAVAVMVVSVSVSAFGASKEKVMIGIAFSTLESEFWQSLLHTTEDTAHKLGAETTAVDAANNITKQMAQLEDLIAKKVDAIVLNAVDSEAVVPIVNKAAQQGISVVTIDRAISPKATVACYVGTDNTLAGRMAATYIAEKLGGKGNVVILNGPPQTMVARLRNAGFMEGLKEYPKIKILTQKWGSSDRAVNMTNMEDILTRFPKVDAVLTFSDFNALGASDAIIARGKQKGIIIGSIDGLKETAQLMKAGKTPIVVTVAQDPAMMARYAARVAYEAATGERVPIAVSTWIADITPQNASEYLESFK